MMKKYSSVGYDWSVAKKREAPGKSTCKFVLSKKFIRLAVLRNRIKRVVRVFAKREQCCFFRIKTPVTKKNCEIIVAEIKNSLNVIASSSLT